MHEPLLERIYHLQQSVHRWRLACLALGIAVVSLLAIGGTFGLVAMLQLPNRHEHMELREELEVLRAHAEEAAQAERVARQEAEQQAQAARRALQDAEQAVNALRAAGPKLEVQREEP